MTKGFVYFHVLYEVIQGQVCKVINKEEVHQALLIIALIHVQIMLKFCTTLSANKMFLLKIYFLTSSIELKITEWQQLIDRISCFYKVHIQVPTQASVQEQLSSSCAAERKCCKTFLSVVRQENESKAEEEREKELVSLCLNCTLNINQCCPDDQCSGSCLSKHHVWRSLGL